MARFADFGAPLSAAELHALVQTIAERLGRALERQRHFVRDCDNSFFTLDPAAGASINDLLGSSITYRVAVDPWAGEKVFTLQTVPPRAENENRAVAAASGFSLHAASGSRTAATAARDSLGMH